MLFPNISSTFTPSPTPPRHAAQTIARRLVTCVTNEKEKEDCRERYGWVHSRRLPHYPLCQTALVDFSSYKPVFKLRKQIFRIVAPYGWVDALRHFEGKYCAFYLGLWVRQLAHNPDYEDGTFLPKRREEITRPHGGKGQKTWFHNKHSVGTSNYCFRVVQNIFILIILYSSFIVTLFVRDWFSMKE
jgi:hypothetical protein